MLSLGNKLSLTTQPIYKFVNEHSVDFDGVDDRIVTDGADTVIATVQNGNENYQDVVRLDGTATTIDELVDLTAGNNFLA